jgi:prophage regulatory protein
MQEALCDRTHGRLCSGRDEQRSRRIHRSRTLRSCTDGHVDPAIRQGAAPRANGRGARRSAVKGAEHATRRHVRENGVSLISRDVTRFERSVRSCAREKYASRLKRAGTGRAHVRDRAGDSRSAGGVEAKMNELPTRTRGVVRVGADGRQAFAVPASTGSATTPSRDADAVRRLPRLLRFPAVRERTGLSRSTIWRLERRGEFPKHHRISPNIVGWVEQDVAEWIEGRTKETAVQYAYRNEPAGPSGSGGMAADVTGIVCATMGEVESVTATG